MNTKLLGFNAIDEFSEPLNDLSQFLFLNPELAFKETKAHDYICQFLEFHEFKVDHHFVYETGFRASFKTSEKPHFAIIVEYDALPSVGHACGHNLIAESSIAAALGLQAIMKNGSLCKLTVFGTPAEEGGGGKIKFVTEGAFDDVDLCIMSHPFKFDVLRLPLLAVIGLTITYTGKESHASVAPWEGVNALDAAVLAYQSISCLRQQMLPNCRIHGIISNGGDAPNIIPRLAEMKYFVRDQTRDGLLKLLPRIYACFEGAATVTACEVNIVENCPMYADIVINEGLANLFHKNAVELGISFTSDTSNLCGSSDIGNVSYACPTIHPMFFIGTGAENHTFAFAECAGTEKAHLLSLRQAKAMMGTLADILSDESGELLAEMWRNFRDAVK